MTGPGVVTQGDPVIVTRLTKLPDSMASSAIYLVTLSQQQKMLPLFSVLSISDATKFSSIAHIIGHVKLENPG